jgi:hypothetical protein
MFADISRYRPIQGFIGMLLAIQVLAIICILVGAALGWLIFDDQCGE